MIHLFINALAASAGGGLTYIRNVVPRISESEDVRATVLLDAQLAREFPAFRRVTFLKQDSTPNAALRFFHEQRIVPKLLRRCGADVLLSAGNFALLNSPVPQILLSRNSLYTSRDFDSDLRTRAEWRLWLDTMFKSSFAKWSIQLADRVVAPSQAFADDLREWTGRPIDAIHHGFDRDAFTRDLAPLPARVQDKLASARGALRLLFVSHYNYYRNFETLIRALPLIRQTLKPRSVRLFLTCSLEAGKNPGAYRTETAAALVRELGLSRELVELGSVPYSLLHHVYDSADIYATPAYAESFAHPLVEAMSSGLPVVASDLTVHREICGAAAAYFSRFSPVDLAERVLEVAADGETAARLREAGLARSKEFSWRKHIDQIIALANHLMAAARPRPR